LGFSLCTPIFLPTPQLFYNSIATLLVCSYRLSGIDVSGFKNRCYQLSEFGVVDFQDAGVPVCEIMF